MKNVLLIGFPFPLRRGGSPRLLGIAKYLSEFGYQPVILTAPLDKKSDSQFNIVETGYRNALGFWGKMFGFDPQEDVRKEIKSKLGDTSKKSLLDSLITLAGEIINYPDSEKSWKPYAIKTAEEVIDKENISAIISSSAPLTTHIVAYNLKLKYRIPWIADLRDLWTQNHNYGYSRLRKYFDRNLELKILGAADALVTVSQPWADELGALHKSKKVYAITNGFDPDSVNEPPAPLTEKFTTTYTGLIYAGKQNPTLLFSALGELVADKSIDPDKFEIRFYGPREEWMEKKAAEYGISKIVKQYGQVSRDESLQRQRDSQVLLLLNWDDPEEKGTIPGKVFEYMAALRPILATGGTGDDAIQQILSETKAGYHARNILEAKEWLRERYAEFTLHGRAATIYSEEAVKPYSQREMARKFAEILKQLVNPS